MELSFLDVLLSVISLFILILPTFILAKCKLVGENSAKALSTIVLYASSSALMFTCFQKYEYSARIGWNMLIIFGLTVFIHLAMILLIKFCLKISNQEKLKVLRYATTFGNCGFMGIPFIQTLFYGTSVLGEMLIYAAVINAAFNLISWTLGVYLISGDAKQMSVKKIALNPVIIATVLGFIAFITIKKPIVNLCEEGTTGYSILSKIMTSFDMLGSSVTPLSMMVLGIKLANINLKRLFTEGLAYLNSAFKLVIMGLVVIASVLFLPIDEEVKYAIFLLLCMPTATSATLFALKFDGDADFATVCVLQSTVLSIITIPLMFLLFKGLLGIV